MIRIQGVVVGGHGVAGGNSDSSPYPDGTIPLQIPFFRELGLDLSEFHPATLNISTSPHEVIITNPRHHFSNVRWTDLFPPESFDFIGVTLDVGGVRIEGLGYRPTQDTKVGHWQAATTLEVVAPFVTGLTPRSRLTLELDPAEVSLETEKDIVDRS